MARLRIFAGPNGSGKTTLKKVIKEEWLGVYVNPDDIEKLLKDSKLNFNDFKIKITEEELKLFMKNSFYSDKIDLTKVICKDNKLKVNEINSYCPRR